MIRKGLMKASAYDLARKAIMKDGQRIDEELDNRELSTVLWSLGDTISEAGCEASDAKSMMIRADEIVRELEQRKTEIERFEAKLMLEEEGIDRVIEGYWRRKRERENSFMNE